MARAEQELGRLRSELDFTSIDDVVSAGLHEFIDALQLRLSRIDAAIQQSFCPTEPAEPFRPLQLQTQSQLQ